MGAGLKGGALGWRGGLAPGRWPRRDLWEQLRAQPFSTWDAICCTSAREEWFTAEMARDSLAVSQGTSTPPLSKLTAGCFQPVQMSIMED